MQENNFPSEDCYAQLKDTALLYTNMPFILEKLQKDGHLDILNKSITSFLDKEILFAIKGGLNRVT